jgi:methylphosphotriester-DNA--protein-cysteine methyltransferase
MIYHANSEIDPVTRGTAIRSLIRSGQIRFGGNKQLKIYGTLACASGRRMKITNRVFFQTETEAIQAGYRPCGHCLQDKYKQWKSSQK